MHQIMMQEFVGMIKLNIQWGVKESEVNGSEKMLNFHFFQNLKPLLNFKI